MEAVNGRQLSTLESARSIRREKGTQLGSEEKQGPKEIVSDKHEKCASGSPHSDDHEVGSGDNAGGVSIALLPQPSSPQKEEQQKEEQQLEHQREEQQKEEQQLDHQKEKQQEEEEQQEGNSAQAFDITREGFAAFCGASTAYAAFQAVADPGTVLLCVGSLDGSACVNAEDALPRVLRSLLGYEVKQVACGGLHVAVVTSSGDLFTWYTPRD
jgi:hypothetical protein